MKFLKSFFLKLKAKKTLKTYQKPLLVTLLTMLFINVLVLLIGAAIGMAIDRNYFNQEFFSGSFLAAFIGTVKWMISPNSLTTMNVHDHLPMMVLAIVIIVIGMVLFSGAIIATVTTALRAYIDKKSHAKGKILVEDHFVILNWNSKVPDMILNLMLKGFKNNIVILSDKGKEYIESEVKSLLLTNEVSMKRKVNLIIKQGDCLLRSNLEDISIENATQICVMNSDEVPTAGEEEILSHDLLSLKIVLRLGSFKIRPDCQIVVETDSDETRGQIENLSYKVSSLKSLSIIPVSFNRKIGQIIALSLVAPEISSLYTELFSFEGSEFYSIESEEDIDSYLKTHPQAIPVYKEKRLFVLGENETSPTKTREKPYSNDRKFEKAEVEGLTAASIFIIGDNRKKEFILENLERSKEFGDIDFALHYYDKRDNAKLIEDIQATEGPKKVLILSDDQADPESYDSNVFVTLIELSKAFPDRENITFITELLDSRNLQSIRDFNIRNTIISNKMMSLLITQLAMNQDSKRFFDKVLTTSNNAKSNDFDINVSRADTLIKIEEDMVFHSKAELLRAFYNTFEGEKILIGLCEDGVISLLDSDQDKKEDIALKKDTSFIYFDYVN